MNKINYIIPYLIIVQLNFGPEKVQNESGYIKVRDNSRNLFYWQFESRSNPKTDPLIIWLRSGVGKSTLISIFEEGGPYIIKDDITLEINKQSINSNFNIVQMDICCYGQSYSEPTEIFEVKSILEIQQDVYEFISEFVKNQNLFNNDLYLMGSGQQSYMITDVGAQLIEKIKIQENFKIQFKGIAFGSALIAPELQFDHILVQMTELSIINHQDYDTMRQYQINCRDFISSCHDEEECKNVNDVCFKSIITDFLYKSNKNFQDNNENCHIPFTCQNFTNLEKYFYSKEIKKQLGSNKSYWDGFNQVNFNYDLRIDWMRTQKTNIHLLMKENIEILVWQGDRDLFTPWESGLEWAEAFLGEEFKILEMEQLLSSEDKLIGMVKTFKNFSQIQFEEAGHIVAKTKSKQMLEVMNRWLSGQLK